MKHDIGGEKISASVSSSQLETTRAIHLDVSSDRTKNTFSEDKENKPPPHDNMLSLITNAKLVIPILYPPSEQESFDTNLKVSIAHEKKWKLQPRRACTNNKKQLLGYIKQTSTPIKPTPPVDDASWANFLFGALHTPVHLMPPPQITQGILHSPPEFNRVISIEDNNNTSIALPSLSSLASENITGEDYHSGGRPLLFMRRPRLKLRPRSPGRP